MRIRVVALVLAASVVTLAQCVPAAAADGGVAARRSARLKRGIDLSHWFAQVYDPAGYTKKHFDEYFTSRDADLVARMGFDHVRFTVEPAPMFDEANPGVLNAAYVAMVDDAIQMLLARKLAVIVDIHPSDELKAKLKDDEFVEKFATFWNALARHLSTTDPERVILEILNEPTVSDPYRWMGIQARLVSAIRAGAPRHTIIATGANWSSKPDLLKLEPVSDDNVIYTFHLYDPHTFTHQGATWGADYWKFLTRVPYPSSPEAVEPILPTVSNERAQGALRAYGDERWNADRIAKVVDEAAEWGRVHHVPVYCGEFGVYRRYARADERSAWLRDVTSALEKRGIGWAMWDYAGGFSVVDRKGGVTLPNPETVQALGLRAR